MSQKTITFLGTGAADTTKYYHSCFYVTDEKTGLLVDAGGGNGILLQLEKANIPIENIRHLFITHKHIDHLFGVFWILRFLGAKIAKEKAECLSIYTSQNIIRTIREIAPNFLKEKITDLFDGKINFIAINDTASVSIDDWKLLPFNLLSGKEEQFGFRLTFSDKKSIVCLGDEPYKDALFDSCKDADFLLHDAFCLERDREQFKPHEIHHSTAKEAAEAAKKTSAKNLIIFHTEDKSTFGSRKELYTKEASEYFGGKIFVPDDLEKIMLV